MLKLRVTYASASDFAKDHDDQILRGGMLVRIQAPPELALFDPAELELKTPVGAHTVTGQIVQVLAGVGVAISVSTDQASALQPLRSAAAQAPNPASSGTPKHEIVRDVPAKRAPDAYARVKESSSAEKIQLALHGGRDERTLILRDNQRALHVHVLRNPQIGIDEVLAAAKMTTVSAEVLTAIADRRDWLQRGDIATALVRNPKTPVPVAVRAIDFVPDAEKRRLLKDTSTKQPIRQAAAKKLL